MASPASCIRSAARATFSAYRRLPLRWRLAGGSALLTLVILLGFAAIVGEVTTRRLRADFDNAVTGAAQDYASRLHYDPVVGCRPRPDAYASPDSAVIRVISGNLQGLLCHTTQDPNLTVRRGLATEHGFRVQLVGSHPHGLPRVLVQYARPLSSLDDTVSRVWLVLALGVFGGALLALVAGLAVAQGAMGPILRLTGAAREIRRTRDPTVQIPQPDAEDEVAELARTMEGMLAALHSARAETEAMLERQREFVADASHELRTPLTSVLANLELLCEVLEGESGETAVAALRSSRRMRRLVADLLLLARADAGRQATRQTTDLGEVVVEAASELEPLAARAEHLLAVESEPAPIHGSRDELHRLALNLLENAVSHTPAGTEVRAQVAHENGSALLTVSDDGPGVPAELRERMFERFVRGAGDAGGGSGLGLSIVRAVAESHGGSVELQTPTADGHGTRFVVRLPSS